MIALDAEPSAIAGNTSCAGVPAPLLGSQPRLTENNSISINPSQKIGIDTPTSATNVARWSQMVYWRVAEKIPPGTPTPTAIEKNHTPHSQGGAPQPDHPSPPAH